MKALVIFEENPDRLRMFLREGLQGTELTMLENLNGVIVNHSAFELSEVQNAAYEIFIRTVDGTEGVPAEWEALYDSNALGHGMEKHQAQVAAIRHCRPDEIFLVTFLN